MSNMFYTQNNAYYYRLFFADILVLYLREDIRIMVQHSNEPAEVSHMRHRTCSQVSGLVL